MRIGYLLAAAALAAATAACGQDDSENVMSSEGGSLRSIDVNAALGPEVTGNDLDANSAENSATPVAAEQAAANESVNEE